MLEVAEEHKSSNEAASLPVAKLVFYDFLHHDLMYGWRVLPDGCIEGVPFAKTVACVEAPNGFPRIPETVDAGVLEAAEGVYEVANIFLSLGPSIPVREAYELSIQKMEREFCRLNDTLLDLAEKRAAISQTCEDTTYELEALIGFLQVFDGKQLTDTPGVQRVGAFMTFARLSFDQNYNLNFVLLHWLRDNWTFPYASEKDIRHLCGVFGFDECCIQAWLRNARAMVWLLLTKGDWNVKKLLQGGEFLHQ